MKFNEQYTDALARCKEDPTDIQAVSEISYLFWSSLIDTVGEIVRNGSDMTAFLSENSDYCNFGLCKDVLGEIKEQQTAIKLKGNLPFRLTVNTFTEWLSDLVVKINEGDRKEMIEKDIQLAKIQIRKLESELVSLQDERRQRLNKQLVENASVPSSAIIKQIENLETTDLMLMESLRQKRAIAKGVFMSVDKKRNHFEREQNLQKELAKSISLVESIQDREVMLQTKKIGTQIEMTLGRIIEIEDAIGRMETEINDIQKKAQEISPLEVESRIRKEIEYLRDLVKLSAKRLHIETCPILRSGDKPFSIAGLNECLDRIIEFDPLLFKNDRVAIFGKPGVLIVPGNGNSLYDWKNNRLLVPLVPPGGNFMASIATGMIEYRLDVDEDKRMLNSYNQIPAHKKIRSMFQLRNNLMKDYVIWMTSEYKGYRILEKEKKDWFEHEIAPPKMDIFTPFEYQQFNITSSEFKKLMDSLDIKLSGDLSKCKNDELWSGSIVFYQQGKFQRAMEMLNALIQKDPENLMAYYNCGHIAMKCMNKSQAINSFTEYCNRNPQSWWTRVAREHLRRLQA